MHKIKLGRSASEPKNVNTDMKDYVKNCIEDNLSVIRMQLSECVRSLIILEKNIDYVKEKLDNLQLHCCNRCPQSTYTEMSNRIPPDKLTPSSSPPQIDLKALQEHLSKNLEISNFNRPLSRKGSKADINQVSGNVELCNYKDIYQKNHLCDIFKKNRRKGSGISIDIPNVSRKGSYAELPELNLTVEGHSDSEELYSEVNNYELAMIQRKHSGEKIMSIGKASSLVEHIDIHVNEKTVDHAKEEEVAYGRCDFNRPDCLSISQHDKLEIIEQSSSNFLLVKNVRTGEQGYVPKEILCYEKTLECEEWYYGNASRVEVTSTLLTESVRDGTFLVRKTERKHPYALSVKVTLDGKCEVKHYRIFRNDKNEFYISPAFPFITLGKLIEGYTLNDYQICCKLTDPCRKKHVPVITELSPLYSLTWEIPRNEVILGEKIGSGQFSNVYKGKWKNKEVAIKRINTNEHNEILNEINIMKKLRHRNIILILGYCQDSPILILEEFLEMGTLKEYLKKPLRLCDLTYISFQIADGMEYLSSRNIIHRDLAARNILVADDLIIKISDFGLSRAHKPNEMYISRGNNNVSIPVKWAAPELIYENQHSVKVDVWSFGIVIVEIFTNGADPFPNISVNELAPKLLVGYKMARPETLPIPIYEKICVPCWNLTPDERPTFNYLKSYFADYDATTDNV